MNVFEIAETNVDHLHYKSHDVIYHDKKSKEQIEQLYGQGFRTRGGHSTYALLILVDRNTLYKALMMPTNK